MRQRASTPPGDPVEVFRGHSSIEAEVVRGLLDAHGIPATQYLNWERSRGRVMSLDEALIPGRRAEYVAALQRAHAKWLTGNPDAKRDPAAYNKMWPFQESDNFAITRDGQRVLMRQLDGPPQPALRVIVNWRAALQ